jgi:hypothetical protein
MMKFRSPQNHYTLPIVTGHKYKIHWGNYENWDKFSLSNNGRRAANTDLPIHFVHPFTAVRVKIIVGGGG